MYNIHKGVRKMNATTINIDDTNPKMGKSYSSVKEMIKDILENEEE